MIGRRERCLGGAILAGRLVLRVALFLASVPAVMLAESHATEDAALALEVEHVVTRILALDGDPAYGEYLGGECVTCHQVSGAANGIPPIRGLPIDYTVQAMVEYKLGARANPVMKLMTARLSDEEIAALAVYIADMEE